MVRRPAGEFIRVLMCTAAFGKPTLFVKNGLSEVLNFLEHVIKRHQGDVLTECEATKIKVKNGVVTGVVARPAALGMVIGWTSGRRCRISIVLVMPTAHPVSSEARELLRVDDWPPSRSRRR
jgi:hypothetical protein